MSDNIWRVQIDPYDQVLALTQHMINQGISNLFVRLKSGETVDGATMPTLGSCYADENNWMKDIDFGPPAVIVKGDYSNLRSVLFRITMNAGSCHLRRFIKMGANGRPPVVEVLDMDINEWCVTLPVDVGFVDLDPNTPRGKAVAERSAAKGKPNHSIKELLLDLQSMAFGDAVWQVGNWSDKDWVTGEDGKQVRPPGWKLDEPRKFTDFNKAFQTTIQFCLQQIASNLIDANLTSMGFAIINPDVNKRATFEVKNARYMTYPWTDPSSKNVAPYGLDGDARLNYLLYLETVGQHSPPPDSDTRSVLSSRMGNWTDGRKPGVDAPNKFGTFVLSCSNFMEAFLIPKLSAINRIMSMDISSVRCWAEDNFFSYRWSVGADFSVGRGKALEDGSTYLLQKQGYSFDDNWQQEAKDFLNNYTGVTGNGSQVWRYQDIEWGSSAKHQYTHVGSVEVWMSGDTITFTRLYTNANSNTIVYEGGQWSKFEYKIDPDILDPNVYGKIIAQTKWKVQFQMQEVTDGGMQIGVTYEKPSTSYSGNYDDSQLTYIKDRLDDMYSRAGDNFEYFVNSIRNCLQGQEKSTLPASGVFFFKNPVMNAFGDLVCGLEYNGNPTPGGQINSATNVERDNIPQGSFRNMPDVAKFVDGKDADSKRKVESK